MLCSRTHQAVSSNIRILLLELRILRQANAANISDSLQARQLTATRLFRSVLPVYIILDIMVQQTHTRTHARVRAPSRPPLLLQDAADSFRAL